MFPVPTTSTVSRNLFTFILLAMLYPVSEFKVFSGEDENKFAHALSTPIKVENSLQDTLKHKKPSTGVITIDQLRDSLHLNMQQGNEVAIAKTLHKLGDHHNKRQNPADAIAHYLQAKEYYQELNRHDKVVEMLHDISVQHYQQDQFTQALEYAERAHEMSREIENDSLLAVSAFQLGRIYDHMGKHDSASDLYHVALNFFKRLEQSQQLADIYHWLAEMHEETGRLDSSFQYHQQALDVRQDIGDSAGLADSYHHLGLAYSSKDDLDIALDHLQQAGQIREQLNQPKEAAQSYIQIGQMHARKGNFDSALEYANRALDISNGFNAVELKIESLQLALNAHSTLGNTGRVDHFQQRLDDLQDSLLELRKQEHRKSLMFQMSVNQKVDTLKQLKEKHLAQKAQLEWEHMLLVVAIIALALLFIVLGLLYSRYTYRKRAEENEREKNHELEKLNGRLEALNEEKNEIFQTVSHDLKNPLSGIIGLSDLAITDEDDISREELLEFMKQIETQAQTMNEMITKLLDIRTIESGGHQLKTKPCNITNITRDVISNNTSNAKEKDLNIVFNPTTKSNRVMGDETAISRVLDNFVSNAIKYSPSGKNIYVDTERRNGSVRVEIKDEGPGLSEEDQQKLFTKFGRLSPQPTGGEHSTGLGLYIAKQLMEEMEGNIGYQKTKERGSIFYMELPAVN